MIIRPLNFIMPNYKNFLLPERTGFIKIYILYSFLIHLLLLYGLSVIGKSEPKNVPVVETLKIKLIREMADEKKKPENLINSPPKLEAKNRNPQELPPYAGKQQLSGRYASFSFPMMQFYTPQNLKYYYQSINLNLNNLVQDLLALEDMRDYLAEEISLAIIFKDSGEIESIKNFSPEQNRFLLFLKDKILEKGFPSPRKYGLPNHELRMKIKITDQRQVTVKTNLQ